MDIDREEAKKRLDALEAEAKELREIIEGGMEYEEDTLYVAIIQDCPYLLAGLESESYFTWHSFDENWPNEYNWAGNHETAQAALDYANKDGMVYAFSDYREGMRFFYKKYMGE